MAQQGDGSGHVERILVHGCPSLYCSGLCQGRIRCKLPWPCSSNLNLSKKKVRFEQSKLDCTVQLCQRVNHTWKKHSQKKMIFVSGPDWAQTVRLARLPWPPDTSFFFFFCFESDKMLTTRGAKKIMSLFCPKFPLSSFLDSIWHYCALLALIGPYSVTWLDESSILHICLYLLYI